jgi:hypothetical protein
VVEQTPGLSRTKRWKGKRKKETTSEADPQLQLSQRKGKGKGRCRFKSNHLATGADRPKRRKERKDGQSKRPRKESIKVLLRTYSKTKHSKESVEAKPKR